MPHPWPLDTYQNVYASEPGSAEMPSAGRPFTADVLGRLVARGIGVTPLVLHTGVASLEADELPYPERFAVPATTAERVNATHDAGRRVVAIGTTVVRALESAVGPDGRARAAAGWTDLVITPERGVRLVDGLLTGWHEPEASHLLMLEGGRRPRPRRPLLRGRPRPRLPLARVRRQPPPAPVLTDPQFPRRNRLPWQPISTQKRSAAVSGRCG